MSILPRHLSSFLALLLDHALGKSVGDPTHEEHDDCEKYAIPPLERCASVEEDDSTNGKHHKQDRNHDIVDADELLEHKIEITWLKKLFVTWVDILDSVLEATVCACSLLNSLVGIHTFLDPLHHLAHVNKLVTNNFVVGIESHASAVTLSHLEVT